MKILNICFALTANSTALLRSEKYEQNYENVYKKIVSFLYAHPRIHMAFSFSGSQLSWLQKKHPEFLTIMGELTSRKQIELLGGGYYNPLFPLLFPLDRSGQIELLTAELRRTTGKRPRGMTLCCSAWDNSLVPCFQTCGMEYVLLDSTLVPPSKQNYLPLLVSEQGRSVKVLPVHHSMKQLLTKEVTGEACLTQLYRYVEKAVKNDRFADSVDERGVCITFDSFEFEHFFSTGLFEKLCDAAETTYKNSIRIVLPLEYLHTEKVVVPAYIPGGMQTDISQWAQVPYTPVENKTSFPLTIFDFLQTYNCNHSLYNRMLYVSMLINQCHGDKIRKKAAREKLWAAQDGGAFVCSPDGIFGTNEIRQNAYRNLIEAEKYVRACSEFHESVTSFDYNGDGYNEYICQMEQYNACIARRSGSICELDIMQNAGNYTDNLRRIARFDKEDDKYDRGLFVEHLFSDEEYTDYAKGLPAGSGIFSQVLFSEMGFDCHRQEILLHGTGYYSSLQQPVSLRKKYIANSNGFTVQYILKNESPIALKAHLIVESNYAQTDFSSNGTCSYTVDAISSGQKIVPDFKKNRLSLTNTSFVQITDTASNISFVYEPNEDAGFISMQISFRRPNPEKSLPESAGTTFVASLCWNVDLAAGMEMEKTINYSIITPKKRRSSKKDQK